MKKIKIFLAALMVCTTAITFTSCDDKIEVQQVYDFVMRTMPVPSELKIGETAELRCEILKNGYYDEAQFTLRYFQTDGEGELKLDDGTVFKPNDRYVLDREKFRLYYTSDCEDQQSVDIYIEDNFGQEHKYTFSFTNENVEEPEDDGVE